MNKHRNSPAMPFPKLTRLAAAVAGGLLLAPTLALAQAKYQEVGRIGDTGSWRTPEFQKDWGLAAVGAEYAYTRGLSGAGINAGIMDNGVALWHSDLAGKVSGLDVHDVDCNSREIFIGPEACFSSDGSTRFVYTEPLSSTQLAYLQRLLDDGKITQDDFDELASLGGFAHQTHGTHVAGTVGAYRNGAGMHGVAFDALLHSTTFVSDLYQDVRGYYQEPTGVRLGQGLGSDALDLLFSQMTARHVRVMNYSWGSGGKIDTASDMDAIAEDSMQLFGIYATWAKNNDAIQVWAAGNGSGQIAGFEATLPRYDEAAEPYWLSVVNLGRDGKIDSSSSICALSKDWCISAPGTDIESTIPAGDVEGEILEYKNGDKAGFQITDAEQRSEYQKKTGTSMAAPHVTGGVVLLMERYPYLSSAQVRDVLLTTAQDLGAPGIDEIYGWGLMDLKKAIDGPGQLRVDTDVKMSRRAGGAKVWAGNAWDDWRNDIGGSGKLTKSGAGWLRLSGNNSFAGAVVKDGVLELDGRNTLTSAVQVQGGELLLNGKLENTALQVQGGVATVQGQVVGSATTVDAQGRLQGTGTLADTSVAGTVAPGVAGIGTLRVDGTYTQQAGSTYQLDVGAQGKSDLIDVRGQAQLQGGEVKVTGATLGDKVQILSAHSISGAFADARSSSSQPFLAFKLRPGAKQVDLDVTRGKALASAASTSNQISVAKAADALEDKNALLKRLTQLSAPQATSAFDSVSGEVYASQRTALVRQGADMNDTVASRLRSVQDPFAAQAESGRANGVWVQAQSGSGHLNGDGNAARSQYHNQGFTAGYDRAFGDGWTAGLVGAKGQGDMQVKARGARDEVRSRSLGLYGGKEWGQFALRAGWLMSEHRVDTARQVSYGVHHEQNRAHYDSKGQQGFVEAGYSWALTERFALEPYAQWSRVEVKDPRVQETGGLTALALTAERSRVDFATAGVRFAANLAPTGGQDWLQLGGALAYRHASGDLAAASHATWQGGGSFTSWGAPLDKQATLLNLNLGARLSRNTLLELGYDGQYGSTTHDHALNARFSLKF
ncbi:MAG TPA: autotransporter domain-containing protein [Pseudoxanthomonas sp.]|nr:autotransporter domain-containing protein [Pseudoxanthomonas sp.]